MSGGELSGGNATLISIGNIYGGDLQVAGDGVFTMSGGEISGVSAEEYDPSFIAITNALSSADSWNGVIEAGVPCPIRPYVDGYNNTLVVIYIQPSNATNRTVILSMKDARSTGATMTGDTLNTTGVGTVTITATVPDGLGKDKPFTQDYTIYMARPPVVKGSYSVQETQGGWILTRYSGREANVTIPADLGVSVIAGNAFRENQFITSVVVPEGVTSIEKAAFMRASNLKSISLPSTLRVIRGGVFNYCVNRTSLTIPSGVIVVDSGLFWSSGLTSITVEVINPPLINNSGWPETLTAIYVPNASIEAYKKADIWNQVAGLIRGTQR